MNRTSYFQGTPFGLTNLTSVGSFDLFENKFRGPDSQVHRTFLVKKGNQVLKEFDNCREATAYQHERAEKEARV